jgi:hypothetical protein
MIRSHLRGIHPIAIMCLLLAAFAGSRAGAQDQYIVVNIAPNEVNKTVFEEIGRMAKDKPPGSVGLGIGAIFSYFNQPRDTSQAQIKEFLSLSEQFSIPVVVQLDGEQWWGNRPDLWNWWGSGPPRLQPRQPQERRVVWMGFGACRQDCLAELGKAGSRSASAELHEPTLPRCLPR